MMNKNWFLLEEEVIGTTSDMSWMSNERGDKALFKPDESGDDYLIELNVYRLATFFDIPYSRVLPFTLNNIDGFLSIVEDTRRYHRINGSDLYRNGKKYTSKAVSAGKTNYDDDIDYSLEGLREIVTGGGLEVLCKVAFLDALCRNQDRHMGNIDFLTNLNKNLIAVAPLYDTVMSLSNSFTETTLLGISSKRIYNHQKVFEYISKFDFMQNTIFKIDTNEFKDLCDDLEFGDFIFNRAKDFISLIKVDTTKPNTSCLKLLRFK